MAKVLEDEFLVNRESYQCRETDFGEQGIERLDAWLDVINAGWFLDDLGKMELANQFLNAVEFTEDSERWNEEDYWATPYEFIGGNGGDCEDYALAKYFTLRAMGVSQDRLRIAYVSIKNKKMPHMVLFYYVTPSDPPLVLDNLEESIQRLDEEKYVRVVYTANEEYVWGIDPMGNTSVIGSRTLLYRLDGVFGKMSEELCPLQ